MNRICLRSVWGVFATFVLFILFGTSCSHALSLRNPSYNNIWQDYGGGWSYKYQTSGDVAYWKDGSSERLAYLYNAGQWYDKDITNSWRGLGIAGRPSDFLGDRQWHDMGNGWKFGYTANDDTGWWQDGTSTRLAYMYGGGQWYDFDRTQSWRGIGYASMSSSFLGDGQWHDVRNGWKYGYTARDDTGWWQDGNSTRLAYIYTGGQWYDFDCTQSWRGIGYAGVSATFLGDGQWHDVRNGWKYSYTATDDTGWWQTGNTTRLAYIYTAGQWYDKDSGNSWRGIGYAGVSATFLGDGNYHDVRLSDQYKYYNEVAYYTINPTSAAYRELFTYSYSSGQWKYKISSYFYNLGSNGQSSQRLNLGIEDVGLRWQFASGVNPSSFGFNTSNTTNSFIKYDSDRNGALDRVLYYDDAGHKVAEGGVTAGSKGTRIAVDKTYVGGSSSWNGAYWSYWSSSRPYSPLVLVYDSSGNQLFKQREVNYITGIGYSGGLRDGEAWIWEDTNGNGRYDSNWSSSGDRILHWREQKGGTCGIFTVMNITESVKGNGPTHLVTTTSYPDDTIQWFSDTYNFSPSYNRNTMDLHDSTYNSWGGTQTSWSSNYLVKKQGFSNASYNTNSWTTLVNNVESGKLANVAIDAYEIWASSFAATDSYGHARDADYDGYLDANYVTSGSTSSHGWHAVWVRGFQRDSSNNITHVIIEDSAPIGGAFGRIPVQHFQRAWYEYGNNGWTNVYFQNAPSGWSWSTSGINTWKFNPAVWSTSW